MSNWFPASATRLYQCTVQTDDALIFNATVFPFFDGDGNIPIVMIVDPKTSDLLAFRLEDVKVRLPWFGVVRFEGPIQALDPELLNECHKLWHFDPWWLLKADRYRNYEFKSALVATNCVGKFQHTAKQTNEIYYQRSLRKISFLCVGKEDHQSFNSFKSFALPPISDRPEFDWPMTSYVTQLNTSGWILDPFWETN